MFGGIVFMGRPFQLNGLLRNVHSIDRCLPARFPLASRQRQFFQHQAQCLFGGMPVADLAQISMGCLLPKARKACGWVAGFFIQHGAFSVLVQVGASLMGMLQAMHAACVPKGMAV